MCRQARERFDTLASLRAHRTIFLAIAISLEAAVVYRALTQSITFDEATTFLEFMRGSFRSIFTQYDASNHVLYTLLGRASIALLGASEFALRLPSVLAAAAFFAALTLAVRRVLGDDAIALLAATTIALNPFVLDLLIAARGYALALALFAIGLCFLTTAMGDDRTTPVRYYAAASLALGLAVAAQLTFLFPAAALIGAFAAMRLADHADLRRAVREWRWLALPGSVVATAILAVPLSHRRPGTFYWGAQRITRFVASIVQPSFDHRAASWACGGPAPGDRVPVLAAVACAAAAALVLSAICVAIRPGGPPAARRSVVRFTGLIGGALLLTLLEIAVGRVAFGLRYPEGRTGVYFAVLCPLAAAGAVALLREYRPTRRLAAAGAVLLTCTSMWFASEFTVSYFYDWRFDAGTRRVFDAIVQRTQPSGRPLHVWVGDLEPSITFYSVTRGFADTIVTPTDDTPPTDAFDLFVACSDDERSAVLRFGRLMYVDAVSNAIVVDADRRQP
jgi:hypothetical protein